MVEQPAGNASAPPVATDPVIPFSAEDAASPEQRNANAAVAAAQVAADEAVEVVVASEGAGHGDAKPGAAAWNTNFQHDFALRQAMVLKMLQGGQVYTEEETALIAKGLALLDGVVATGKMRALKHSKPIAYARTKLDKRSGLMTGETEALIRASPEEILASLMHYESKYKLSRLNPAIDVSYETLEEANLHQTIGFFEGKTVPFQNRTFLFALLWQKVSDGTYVWVSVPIEHHVR
jgi:hypothetical protein